MSEDKKIPIRVIIDAPYEKVKEAVKHLVSIDFMSVWSFYLPEVNDPLIEGIQIKEDQTILIFMFNERFTFNSITILMGVFTICRISGLPYPTLAKYPERRELLGGEYYVINNPAQEQVFHQDNNLYIGADGVKYPYIVFSQERLGPDIEFQKHPSYYSFEDWEKFLTDGIENFQKAICEVNENLKDTK